MWSRETNEANRMAAEDGEFPNPSRHLAKVLGCCQEGDGGAAEDARAGAALYQKLQQVVRIFRAQTNNQIKKNKSPKFGKNSLAFT